MFGVFFGTSLSAGRLLLVSGDLFAHWPSDQTELFLLTSMAWNRKRLDLQYKVIIGE